MRPDATRTTPPNSVRREFLIPVLCLTALLCVLFHKSFLPGQTVFSNDGPLGVVQSQADLILSNLNGVWEPLNWLGTASPGGNPSLGTCMVLLSGPLVYSKIITPVSLLGLGLCAWFYFRQLRFSPMVCVIGGIAATLNMDYFSNSCWGQPSRPWTLAAAFLALAALQNGSGWRVWIKSILAGMAVGFAIMESFDLGALFSLVIAAFALFQGLIGDGPVAKKLTHNILRIALVALFAALVSAKALSALIGTQIKGVSGMQQDEQTRTERWDWATQWSLPKAEVLQFIIPGLFGYRMDTPQGMAYFQKWFEGGNYWGKMGRDAEWERYLAGDRQGSPPAGGFIRYSGGASYAGLIVVVLSIWAVRQSFRKQSSPFSSSERKYIWFWSGLAALSLLLSFGRHAPLFYKLFYALPYASTIRNPAKFMHIFDWAQLVIFAYGLQGFSRVYLGKAGAATKGAQLKSWWGKAMAADPTWTIGSVIALVTGLLGWLVYASSRGSLESYLQTVGFDAANATAIAQFSVLQVGWFVLFLALTVGLVALIMSGRLAGGRAKWGGILLGLLLTIDLARANLPWIIYYNYQEKYIQAANNPVIDLLKQKPYEHRVALLPFQAPPQLSAVRQVYQIEWMQHLFQYYKIQSLDIVQMSRPPEDLPPFEGAFRGQGTPLPRRWELTNTRYLLGAAGFLEPLNQQIDPVQKRFRIQTLFDFYQTAAGGSILTRTNSTGPYALFEFTGALPRAKLYSKWEVAAGDPVKLREWVQDLQTRVSPDMGAALGRLNTNDQATLKQLTDPTFDPHQIVLVAGAITAAAPVLATNQNAGTVEFISYAPKHVVLRAKVEVPSVLLLSDRFDPNWRVAVDSQHADLLRCNFLMRGVQLAPGEHKVEFHFSAGEKSLYVSLAAMMAGFALLAVVVVSNKREPAEV